MGVLMAESVNQRCSELIKAKRRGDVDYLVAALTDAEIRAMAVKYLGQLGATEAVPQVRRLLAAGDPITRSTAIRALTRLDAREAVADLEDLIESDSSGTVRTHAVSAFRRLGEPADTIPVLFRALRDPDGGVSACAAHQLGVIGDHSAIEPLREAQRSHSWIRAGAYRKAIRRIKLRNRGWTTQLNIDRVQPIYNIVGFIVLAAIALSVTGHAAFGDLDSPIFRLAVVLTAGPFGLLCLVLAFGSLHQHRDDLRARRALRSQKSDDAADGSLRPH